MKIKVNENIASFNQNYLFSEINSRIARYSEGHPGERIIRLGIGDVTLPLGKTIVGAAVSAAEEMGERGSFHGYAPEGGYPFLRDTIAENYRRFGVSLDSDEIFVSDGAKSDAGNIADILGDNPVYISDPIYPVYMDANIIEGRRVRLLEGRRGNSFLPMPNGEIESGAVIYLCSPGNPTGAVYSHGQLKEWVDFARGTGSLIIFDAAYEAFISEEYPHSIYEISGAEECAVEICSLSKTAGFTGMRCAWTVFPESLKAGEIPLGKLWSRRQATKFNGVPYIIQRAAQAALSERGMEECRERIGYYMENAARFASFLDSKGIYYTGGKNSPYIWMECPGGVSSWDFFDYLLKKIQVAGTPGAGFGAAGEGYFRLSSFGTREDCTEAIKRLETVI